MRLQRHRRQNQRGFALLLVFAMAAAVAVMLYLEMPRVAFEHERNKEALLVERGDQYVRAIQLYYKKYSKYPQTLDDLETTNNIRFLRRRYKDPMTGSEEWRLIHVDGTGQYTDSLIHKRNPLEEEKKGASVLSSNIVGIGTSAEYVDQANGQTQSAAATTRRASDRIIPGAPGSTAGQSGAQAQDPNAADDPNNSSRSGSGGPPQPPGVQPGNVGATPQNGQSNNGLAALPGGASGQPTTPGQSTPGAAQGQAGGSGSAGSSGSSGGGFGFGGGFGSGSSSGSSSNSTSANNASSSPFSNRSGSNSSGNSSSPFGGFNSGSNSSNNGFGRAPNQAVSSIQNMLTNPNSGTGTSQGNGLAAGAGGLVGVASKKDMEGILIYNEHTNVKEWEFVFDQKKATAGLQGNNMSQQGQNNQQNQNGSSSSSGFSFGGSGSSSSGSSSGSSGSSSGFGNSSSFGFGGSGSSSSSGSSGTSSGGFSLGGSTGTAAPGGTNKP